ncbi:MAG: DegT/DnrJ/EryC1/StrS family aminotransferase [Saprospiraceae bacterium]
MKNIPFSPPHIDQAVIDEVIKTLQSGWITTGPRTKQLEKEVAKISHADKVMCVNSATAGMELMLRWLGVQPGDEVIVPAYTYCATANVVMHCGAKPIMVDIKADDFTINLEKIANAITEKTKAIMPVDLGGMPCDYQAIRALVNDPKVRAKFKPNTPNQEKLARIAIITDAAHSIGSQYQQRPAASYADASVFSFHAVKNLTTAEGGAISLHLPDVFDPEVVYKELYIQSLHGQTKDALAKFGKNAWEYDVTSPGYKYNMPDVLAAIGLVQIKRYESETLPQRRSIFDAYTKALSAYDWAELPIYETEEKVSSYHLYLLRIKGISLAQRNAIIEAIFATGVSVNVHYKPLPLLSVYKNLGYEMSDYPVAQDCFHREISLPVFYDLNPAQVDRVIQSVVDAVEKVLGA